MRNLLWAIPLGAALLIGCGSNQPLQPGGVGSDAVKWTNRTVAFGQCVQEAAVSEDATVPPEAGSQACLVQWFPELPVSSATTKLASDFATCVRAAFTTTASLPKADKVAARSTGASACVTKYSGDIVAAILNRGK